MRYRRDISIKKKMRCKQIYKEDKNRYDDWSCFYFYQIFARSDRDEK